MPLYFMPTQMETDPRGRLREVSKWIELLRPFGEAKLEFPGRHALIHSNCDASTDAIVSADPDVIRIPDDLDSLISFSETLELATHLDANGLPSSWVEEGAPWRQLVRRICAFYQSTQRHQAIYRAPLIPKDVAPDAKMSDLKPAQRTTILAATQSMATDSRLGVEAKQGFAATRADFKQTQSVADVMTSLADAWGDEPIQLMGVNL